MDIFSANFNSINSTLLIVLLLYLLVLITIGLRFLQKSDKRAKSVLESIDDFFITFDNKWRFSYVNARACQTMGFSREQLLGKKITDIYPGFDETIVFKQYIRAKRIKKPLTFPIVGMNGKDFNARVFPTNEGLSVYLHDVTRVKQYERQLVESEKRFRSIADCAPVMIWLSGPDMKRYYFNQKWLEFRGRRWQEEVGEGWMDGIHEEDKGRFKETYLASGEARIEFEMEYRLLRSDGAYRWMLSRCMPRFDRAGKFLGYAGTVLDITDRKEIEERKNEFISIASHELKTPVTSVKAFTQLLLYKHAKNGDALTFDYLKRMDSQLNNLTNLINDLLDVSKIEQGKLQFNKELISFDELVREVVSDMQAMFPKHLLMIEGNYKCSVQGDQQRLCQVLINLIENAIRYSPGKNEVLINSRSNNHSVVVSVRDFGLGIPEEKQSHLFERFFRVNGPKSETFGGLGLGLYICGEIIKRHGGTMTVKSKVGEGSTFSFSIPLAQKVSDKVNQRTRHSPIGFNL